MQTSLLLHIYTVDLFCYFFLIEQPFRPLNKTDLFFSISLMNVFLTDVFI